MICSELINGSLGKLGANSSAFKSIRGFGFIARLKYVALSKVPANQLFIHKKLLRDTLVRIESISSLWKEDFQDFQKEHFQEQDQDQFLKLYQFAAAKI